MSEGEQGTISAEVIPAGTPVAWSSSDETVATVDGGNVVAVAIGNATITASITVEGVTYTDTATVEVEAAPIEYQTVFNFTNDEFFFNDSNWLQKLYGDTNRETFFTKGEGLGDPMTLNYSEEGAPSSLYVDFRIAMQDVAGWDWNIEKNYALRVALASREPDLTNWNFKFSLTKANENFFTSDIGDVIINSNAEETFIPLACRDNITLPRLLSLQIKKDTPSGNYFADCEIVLELVELL